MKHNKSMEKENQRRLLGLMILSVLILSAFVISISVVRADPIEDMFTKWKEGEGISVNVAKYLFIILLVLLIWSILDTIKISKNQIVNLAIAIIVAVLAGAYLAPEAVWATFILQWG